MYTDLATFAHVATLDKRTSLSTESGDATQAVPKSGEKKKEKEKGTEEKHERKLEAQAIMHRPGGHPNARHLLSGSPGEGAEADHNAGIFMVFFCTIIPVGSPSLRLPPFILPRIVSVGMMMLISLGLVRIRWFCLYDGSEKSSFYHFRQNDMMTSQFVLKLGLVLDHS